MRHFLTAALLTLTLPALPLPALAQVKSDTARLGYGTTDPVDSMIKGYMTGLDYGGKTWVGKTFEETGKAAAEDAALLNLLSKDVRYKANLKKLPPDVRKKILDYGDEIADRASRAADQSAWLKKAAKFVEVVDVVSTGAKALAYASEGDSTGAAAIIARDIAKKLSEGAGMLGLSWVPGGSVLGAYWGERIYMERLDPKLLANEKRVRDQEYAEMYLNKPWLVPVEIMGPNGTIRVLAPDMYFDRQKGAVQRRSPQDQAAYEAAAKIRWDDARNLIRIEQDLADGTITAQQHAALMHDYRTRDTSKAWEPRLLPDTTGDTTAKEGILAHVTPMKVTATMTLTTQYVKGEIRLTFWNVGSQAPGYGAVTGTATSTVAGHGTSTTKLTGTFSGGPNGLLSLQSRAGGSTVLLRDGKTLSGSGASGTIDNPAAFANWP